MAAERLSWLARNGRSPGEESLAAVIAARRSRLAVLWPDHAKEAARVARRTACQGEDVAGMGPCKRRGFAGEGTETLAYGKAVPAIRDHGQRIADTGSAVCRYRRRSI